MTCLNHPCRRICTASSMYPLRVRIVLTPFGQVAVLRRRSCPLDRWRTAPVRSAHPYTYVAVAAIHTQKIRIPLYMAGVPAVDGLRSMNPPLPANRPSPRAKAPTPALASRPCPAGIKDGRPGRYVRRPRRTGGVQPKKSVSWSRYRSDHGRSPARIQEHDRDHDTPSAHLLAGRGATHRL